MKVIVPHLLPLDGSAYSGSQAVRDLGTNSSVLGKQALD